MLVHKRTHARTIRPSSHPKRRTMPIRDTQRVTTKMKLVTSSQRDIERVMGPLSLEDGPRVDVVPLSDISGAARTHPVPNRLSTLAVGIHKLWLMDPDPVQTTNIYNAVGKTIHWIVAGDKV